MKESRARYYLEVYLKLIRPKKQGYSNKEIITFYSQISAYLTDKNIGFCITKSDKIIGKGICLINVACFTNELYFLLCQFNTSEDSYYFYDFTYDRYFYSSKQVLHTLINKRCLLFA